MANKDLVAYIQIQQQHGVPDTAYVPALLAQGWTAEDIREAHGALIPKPVVQKSSRRLKILVTILIIVVLAAVANYFVIPMLAKNTNEPLATQPITDASSGKSLSDIYKPKEQPKAEQAQPLATTVGDSEVKIISPAKGTKVLGGSTVTFTVVAGKNSKTLMFMANAQTGGDAGDGAVSETKSNINGGTFTFEYNVPESALGSMVAMAMGTAGMGDAVIDQIDLIVETKATTTKINPCQTVSFVPVPSPSMKDPENMAANCTISALFSDGVKRPLPAAYAKITIADPTIAKIKLADNPTDDTFLVLGLKKGKSTITISYQNATVTIPIETYNYKQ